MIHWVWIIFSFLCGIVVTLLCMKRILFWVMLHNLGWASSRLKKLYEVIEKARATQLKKQ